MVRPGFEHVRVALGSLNVWRVGGLVHFSSEEAIDCINHPVDVLLGGGRKGVKPMNRLDVVCERISGQHLLNPNGKDGDTAPCYRVLHFTQHMRRGVRVLREDKDE